MAVKKVSVRLKVYTAEMISFEMSTSLVLFELYFNNFIRTIVETANLEAILGNTGDLQQFLQVAAVEPFVVPSEALEVLLEDHRLRTATLR